MENNNINFDPMTGKPIKASSHSDKGGNKKLIIIIIVTAIIVAIMGIIFIPKLFNNKKSNNAIDSLKDSTSFWVENDKGLYAIFDINGRKITDFKYRLTDSDFFNGVSRVQNENDEYGLISSSGKMLVDFGKYEYISDKEAVYVMRDKDYNSYLYNSAGKLIKKLDEDEEVLSYVTEDTFALLKSSTEYKVINYNGEEIVSIPIPKNSRSIKDPVGTSKDKFVSIFYNDKNYIIDISKKKIVLTLPDSRYFCVNDINEENDNEFILNTCYSDVESSYKFVRDGKIVYTKEEGSIDFKGNNVVYNDDNNYLLDENGNEKINVNFSIIYKDYNNYIRKLKGSQNGAELYVNGTLKEKISCNNIQGGYAKYGVYLLGSCQGYGDNDKIYINYDGTRINDKSYKRAYEFDNNGYASVSEDGKKYYLINLKGEKVSDYYSNNSTAEKIYNLKGTDDLYYGTNEDGTTTIFEINGKKLATGKKNDTIVSNGVAYAIMEKDGKYTIRDLRKEKDIVTVDSKPSVYGRYFTTSSNSKKQYYSFVNGKMFYEK